MNNFNGPPGFFGFISELPLFFKIFGGLVLTLVVGGFSYAIIKGLKTWSSNNAAEIMKKRCKVVDKRTEVSGDRAIRVPVLITILLLNLKIAREKNYMLELTVTV